MANNDLELTRREAAAILAAGGAALLTGQAARAQEPPAPTPPARPQALAGSHQVLPLGFDPKALRGLSERLMVSHHENNYAGAVRNLNRVEQDLATVTKDTPGFQVFGLQERALLFRNSKTLHELYFANLGGDGNADGAAKELLAAQFGGFGRFEELFRATAVSLAGGSGWAVLAVQLADASPVIYAAADHTRSLPQGVPLLVLDMYEHAYHGSV